MLSGTMSEVSLNTLMPCSFAAGDDQTAGSRSAWV